MTMKPCVFPDASEHEWQTIHCADGSALRMWVQTGADGYVRLQQLAHGDGVGWYVQRTFVIPGEALALLLPQLRQAACVIQSPQDASLAAPGTLRLVGAAPVAERLGA